MDTVPIKAWTSATGHTIHNGNLVYFCPRTGFGEEQASNFPQLGVKGRKQVGQRAGNGSDQQGTVLGLIQFPQPFLSSYLTLVAICELLLQLRFYSQQNQAQRVQLNASIQNLVLYPADHTPPTQLFIPRMVQGAPRCPRVIQPFSHHQIGLEST